jgi:phosphatidylserine/phosphatidylglycerophosphate/cardiolipin synthase-like enzyme
MHVIIGPENQRERLIAFIKSAQHSLKLYQQYLNDEAIKNALIEKRAEGVDIRIIMMPYPTGYERGDPNAACQDELVAHGVDVRMMCDLYQHLRLVIVDDVKTLIGTAQLSKPSLEENREITVELNEASTQRLRALFEHDWQMTRSLQDGRDSALEKK